jgi:hypothetical protein
MSYVFSYPFCFIMEKTYISDLVLRTSLVNKSNYKSPALLALSYVNSPVSFTLYISRFSLFFLYWHRYVNIKWKNKQILCLIWRRRGRSSSPGRVKNFLPSKSSRPALESTQLPIQCVQGALSPRVKRLGREADHLPTASAEVKKMWIYTSTPPYAFMA